MDELLIKAYEMVIKDLTPAIGYEPKFKLQALAVITGRKFELENWHTFEEVPD